jgi:hypothetical protein
LIFIGDENVVLVPSGTDVFFCTESSNHIPVEQEETNGFGLKIFKHTFSTELRFCLNQFSPIWLLFNASEELMASRNYQIDARVSLKNHTVTLHFGSLISPYQFKRAESKFCVQTYPYSSSSLFFAKCHSSISINIDNLRFQLKREHIDNHRGVIINGQSIRQFTISVCLKGNIDEYLCQNPEDGMLKIFYSLVFLLLSQSYFVREKTRGHLFLFILIG